VRAPGVEGPLVCVCDSTARGGALLRQLLERGGGHGYSSRNFVDLPVPAVLVSGDGVDPQPDLDRVGGPRRSTADSTAGPVAVEPAAGGVGSAPPLVDGAAAVAEHRRRAYSIRVTRSPRWGRARSRVDRTYVL